LVAEDDEDEPKYPFHMASIEGWSSGELGHFPVMALDEFPKPTVKNLNLEQAMDELKGILRVSLMHPHVRKTRGL
jgi:hypothetical protein